MISIPMDEMNLFPDPSTDERLLPSFMIQESNADELCRLKAAARVAMERFLTDEQREVLYKHYWNGMSKTAIGAELGIGPSAVCKRLSSAHETIKHLAEYYFEVQRLVKAQMNAADIS